MSLRLLVLVAYSKNPNTKEYQLARVNDDSLMNICTKKHKNVNMKLLLRLSIMFILYISYSIIDRHKH